MSPYIVMAKLNTNYSQSSSWFIFGERYLKYKIGIVLGIFAVLSGFYVFQINQLAVLGYEIKRSEKNSQTVKKDIEKLQFEVEKMRTVANLRQKAQSFNMAESQKVSYIDISGGGLVFSDRIRPAP